MSHFSPLPYSFSPLLPPYLKKKCNFILMKNLERFLENFDWGKCSSRRAPPLLIGQYRFCLLPAHTDRFACICGFCVYCSGIRFMVLSLILSYLYNESYKKVDSYAEGGEKRIERGGRRKGGREEGRGVKVVLVFAPVVFKLSLFSWFWKLTFCKVFRFIFDNSAQNSKPSEWEKKIGCVR